MSQASAASHSSQWPVVSIAEAHARLTAPGMPFEMETMTIRGIETRVWKNAPPDLRSEVLACRAFVGREFIVYENERVTFDGFHRAVAHFAAQLIKDGVRKGDRVA